MNTNRITNKSLKRFAVTAGTTAATLFLAAGLVACDPKTADEVVARDGIAEVADVLQNLAAGTIRSSDQVAATEARSIPATASTHESTPQETKQTVKRSKKKPASGTGDALVTAPTVVDPSPTPQPTIAAVPQTSETPVAATPTEQAAATNTTSNVSTWSNIPKITGTPSLTSNLSGTDLTKLGSSVTLPNLCIPGVTC